MKKVIAIHGIFFILISYYCNAQSFNMDDYPPIWADGKVQNTLSYLFPFKDQSTFDDAVIYFEKKENSNFVIMRFRAMSKFVVADLRMKSTPTMMVKLGDGTVLNCKKERVIMGVVNGAPVIEVYFNLYAELQNKILEYGIEKVRIAYVFTYAGIERNQIFDAFSADCEEDGLSAGLYLSQILNANIANLKQEAKKKNLDYGF
jgi:hypothetical protein